MAEQQPQTEERVTFVSCCAGASRLTSSLSPSTSIMPTTADQAVIAGTGAVAFVEEEGGGLTTLGKWMVALCALLIVLIIIICCCCFICGGGRYRRDYYADDDERSSSSLPSQQKSTGTNNDGNAFADEDEEEHRILLGAAAASNQQQQLPSALDIAETISLTRSVSRTHVPPSENNIGARHSQMDVHE